MQEVKRLVLGSSRLVQSTSQKNTFFILNKDKILAKCEWWDDNHARILQESGLPTFISNYLDTWLSSRTPPKHRANIKGVLKQLGLDSTRTILKMSKGLSLIDTLWVTEDTSTKWADVNLFENPFNDLIANIAFAGVSVEDIVGTTSPEFGTDGMLAKCWRRVGLQGESGVWLYKTGTYPEMEDLVELELRGASNLAELEPGDKLPQTGLEPYAEVACHQVLEALGWSHVPYVLGTYRGKTVSVCPLMTSVDRMFLNMQTFKSWKQGDVLNLAERFDFLKDLARMYVFDYIMLGVDRHSGNYGVQLDAKTFNYCGFNPLFDHGNSLLSLWENKGQEYGEFLDGIDLMYNLQANAKTAKVLGFEFPELSNLAWFTFNDAAFGAYPSWALRQLEEIMAARLQQFTQL